MSEEREISCEEALKRMFEYIDRELHVAKQGEMERHLATCRSCYSRLEFEQRLQQHIRSVGGEKASDRLQAMIKDLIRKL